MGTKQNRKQNRKEISYFHVNIIRNIYMYMLYHNDIMLSTRIVVITSLNICLFIFKLVTCIKHIYVIILYIFIFSYFL